MESTNPPYEYVLARRKVRGCSVWRTLQCSQTVGALSFPPSAKTSAIGRVVSIIAGNDLTTSQFHLIFCSLLLLVSQQILHLKSKHEVCLEPRHISHFLTLRTSIRYPTLKSATMMLPSTAQHCPVVLVFLVLGRRPTLNFQTPTPRLSLESNRFA